MFDVTNDVFRIPERVVDVMPTDMDHDGHYARAFAAATLTSRG